jgi:hypothetical protein
MVGDAGYVRYFALPWRSHHSVVELGQQRQSPLDILVLAFGDMAAVVAPGV